MQRKLANYSALKPISSSAKDEQSESRIKVAGQYPHTNTQIKTQKLAEIDSKK
jgi:hypothetical protein